MQPDKTQIERIQTMLYAEGAAVTFYKHGTKIEDGYWYVVEDGIYESGPMDKDGASEFYEERDIDGFIEFASKNNLAAVVNLDAKRGSDEPFEDWEHLARYMGVTDLVVISAKVPKRIAEKFQFYATKDTTVSNKLRELVYDFVVSSIKENAEKDAFR